MISSSVGDTLNCQLLPPEEILLMVKSTMVSGCYYPLSKTQLEWQFSISDTTARAEAQQNELMQARVLTTQKLKAKCFVFLLTFILVVWTECRFRNPAGV